MYALLDYLDLRNVCISLTYEINKIAYHMLGGFIFWQIMDHSPKCSLPMLW